MTRQEIIRRADAMIRRQKSDAEAERSNRMSRRPAVAAEHELNAEALSLLLKAYLK